MSSESFFNTYFLNPLYAGDAVYNIYNTAVYAVILIIAVFAIYKILKKLEIPIDLNFFVAATPYILLAGVFRVLRDSGILTSPIFVAPLIYITVFALAFSVLLVTITIEKRYRYHYDLPMFAIGLALLLYFGRYLSFPKLIIAGQVLGLTALTVLIIYALNKVKNFSIFTPMNIFILSAAMFDAASTFVGVSLYGYGEKHVLPNFLFGIFGPWIMFPLKFAVVLLALWAIDSAETDSYFKNFLKFAILCVTLGPGTRNTLRMIMGV